MSESVPRKRWRPSRTHLVAGTIVIVGFWLTSFSWWFHVMVGAGLLGPGILREMGWLHDKDEFQQRADHRAGYRAFLIAGMVAFALDAFFRTGGTIERSHQLAEFFLVLLLFTWFLNALLAYWGPQKTATRMLFVFGTIWLGFLIISNTGSEWTGWTALLLHPLLAVPFFFLAWLAGRLPRVTGGLLLAVATFFLWFFGGSSPKQGGLLNEITTVMLFLGPLAASGIALLTVGKDGEYEEEEYERHEEVLS